MISKIKTTIGLLIFVLLISNNANSQTYRSMIMGEFSGWNGNSAYLLDNGGLIVQKDYTDSSYFDSSPGITLLKNNDKLYAVVDHTNDNVEVNYYSKFYEGRINGEFKGWDGDTIYQLMDGHIVKQMNYNYHYEYKYSPEVIIIRYNNMNRIFVVGSSENVPIYVSIIR